MTCCFRDFCGTCLVDCQPCEKEFCSDMIQLEANSLELCEHLGVEKDSILGRYFILLNARSLRYLNSKGVDF